MMPASITVAPSNSLIGISDVKKGVVPTSMPESGIAATESCILVGCYPEGDGETRITLGPASDVDPGYAPAFDGQLATPTAVVRIVTIDWKPLLEARVPAAVSTRVRVWKNHARWPGEIIIGLE
jgi:hypothetical protein